MPLIVEDGSQVANSNSYSTDAEFLTYIDEIGYKLEGDEIELMIQSSRYIETLSYNGNKYTKDQSMQFPRVNMSIDGFLIDVDEIPSELKTLQFEVAISIDKGIDPSGVLERVVKSEKVDVLTTVYADDSTHETYQAIEQVARKLIKSSVGYLNLSRA
ncbi:MAG: hypothetical protein DRH08_01050 [Deltaproteobacteria bacterium]|nr:MAG: hypothetical protein DRH08_01050 [Deltaproteobacteria bacterium]